MKITTSGKILRDGKTMSVDKKKKINLKLFPIPFQNLFKTIRELGLKMQNGLIIKLFLFVHFSYEV